MSIEIHTNGVVYTVSSPEIGYSVQIAVAIQHIPTVPFGYNLWDNGVARDYRTSKASFLMSQSDTASLIDIFANKNKGRGISATLRLGAGSSAGSGYYPFGPDHGDRGDFDVRILTVDPGPQLEEPWLWYRTVLEMVEESNPAYVLPAEQDEGDVEIGTIDGLRWPTAFPAPGISYGMTTQLTRNGTAYTVDKRADADSYTTNMPMRLRQNKAAALIDHLVTTVRAANVTITPGASNGYIFGAQKGEGPFVCNWLDEVVPISHTGWDQFEFPLNFQYVSG